MEERFEGSAAKIMELCDKVVNETIAFLRKECRENIGVCGCVGVRIQEGDGVRDRAHAFVCVRL